MDRRVALISGGTRGIGNGIARRLLTDGVIVSTCYHRDEENAENLKKVCRYSRY